MCCYSCTRCEFASRRRDTMRSHIRTKHPGEPYHFLCMEDPSLKDDMDAMMAIQNGPAFAAAENEEGGGGGASHKNEETSATSSTPTPAAVRQPTPKKSKKARNQTSQKSNCGVNAESSSNAASKIQNEFPGGNNSWQQNANRPHGGNQANCQTDSGRDKNFSSKNDEHPNNQKQCSVLPPGSDASNAQNDQQQQEKQAPPQNASGSGSQPPPSRGQQEEPGAISQSPVNTQGSPSQPPMGSYPRDMPRLEAVSPYAGLPQHAHAGIGGSGEHPPMYSPYWNMGHGPRGIQMAEELVRHSLPPLQAFAYTAHPGGPRGPSLADVQRFQSVGTPPCSGDFSSKEPSWNPNRNLLPPRNSVQPSASNCSDNRPVGAQQHQITPYW
jgi:hypothetical protein